MENLLEKYVGFVLSSYRSLVSPSGDKKINVRCPVCGDSKKDRGSKRGYFLMDRTPYVYYCHNSGCDASDGISVKNLLKKYFPPYYEMYIKDLLKKNRTDSNDLIQSYVGPDLFKDEVKIDKKEKEIKKKQLSSDLKFFVPIKIGQSEIFKTAINYCITRKIPEHIWSKFFVATSGKYANRLIIPFYDDKGKIYYFQGRSLVGQEPKYLNKVGKRVPYNIFNLDLTKKVVALEGPIDSTFVDNSVALVGLNFDDEFLEWCKENDVHFLLDNDKSGKQKSLELILLGLKVFNWKVFLKDHHYKPAKDVNELILLNNLDRFTFEDLSPYFTNNIRQKVFFV